MKTQCWEGDELVENVAAGGEMGSIYDNIPLYTQRKFPETELESLK